MNSNADQSSQIYIPDFKAWERIYQSKVASRAGVKEKSLAVKRPAEVKLQFVSPVKETIDRAESEIKSSGKNAPRWKKTKTGTSAQGSLPRPLKVKDVIRASAPRQQPQKRQAKNKWLKKEKEGATNDSKKFSYRTLNDIFSTSR